MYKDVEYSFSVAGQFLSDASLNIRRLIEKKRILIRHRSLEKIVSDGRRQDRGQNSFLTPSIFCIACLYVSLSVCRSLSACTSLCRFGGLSLPALLSVCLAVSPFPCCDIVVCRCFRPSANTRLLLNLSLSVNSQLSFLFFILLFLFCKPTVFRGKF